MSRVRSLFICALPLTENERKSPLAGIASPLYGIIMQDGVLLNNKFCVGIIWYFSSYLFVPKAIYLKIPERLLYTAHQR
jgi:hypothetical protein